jgi:hypothetical protein
MKFPLAFFLIMMISHYSNGVPFVVKNGVLDLRTWDYGKSPVISLDGEWRFAWNTLLLSTDFEKNATGTFAQLSVPWNEQRIDGTYLPKDGCASYYLKILLPAIDSVSFAVPAVFNSYAFWVNDQLIASSGKVGINAAQTIPKWHPQTVTVRTSNDTLRVVFQIANFQHTRGGCSEIMRIGTPSHLQRLASVYHTSGLSLTGAIGLVVYFVVRSRGFLFLALLSLAFAVRFLFSDLYFYDELGIEPGWLTVARIEYSSIPVIVLCGAFFIATIYPQEFRKVVLNAIVAVNVILVVVTMLVPSSFFSPLLVVHQITGVVVLLYFIYAIVKALTFPRKGAWVTALGTGIFCMVGLYNIYAFITLTDLNRTIIHSGYAIALILNVVSLLYRTPLRLLSEEQDMLRFSDFYGDKESAKI